jgi:hypothetical protein
MTGMGSIASHFWYIEEDQVKRKRKKKPENWL